MKKKLLSCVLMLSMLFVMNGTTALAATIEIGDVGPVYTEKSEQKAYEPENLVTRERLDGEIMPDESELNDDFPESYDSRTEGITSVKDQNPYATGWAFAQTAIAEANAIKKGIAIKPDYSEYHLAYFLAHRVVDKMGLTYGDKNNFKQDYLQYGNGYMATRHLATWSGFAAESSVPYSNIPTAPATSKAYSDEVILKNAYYLSDSMIEVKNAIINYGAVSASFYWDADYHNYSTASYGMPENPGVNHTVTIIGWDDNYLASNFVSESAVEANGAWLVKNSWGTGWGNEGYFHISYEDESLGEFIAIEVEDADEYDNNYQYDGSAGNSYMKLRENWITANVYTIKADGNTAGQTIKAVQFNSWSPNVEYSIQIYKDVDLVYGNPTNGTKCLETEQTGTTGSAGIITVDLDNPVFLLNDTKFSVVITFLSDVKIGYEISNSTSEINFVGYTESGQSYYRSPSGSWEDISASGLCLRIKAFTVSGGETPDTVTNVDATVTSATSVKVSWNKVNDTDGYIIYRKAPGSTRYEYYDEVESSVSSYADSDVTKGSSYSYIVYAYFNYNGEKILGPESEAVTIMAGTAPVTNLKASGVGKGKVKLTWTKSIGEPTGYIIYRKVGNGEFKYLYIVNGTSTSYTDTTASDTEYNFYRIYPYITVNGKRMLASSTSYVYARGILDPVTNLKAAGVSGGVKLTWTKSAGTVGYIIYAKHPGDSKFNYLYIVGSSSTSYIDKEASKSEYNFYRVYPYKVISGKRVLGPSTTYVYGKAK